MSRNGVVAELNKKAARLMRGAISLSSSSHLPAIVGSIMVKPVALAPGRARLSTKPLPTGSATITNTTGMVRVCFSIEAVGGGLQIDHPFKLDWHLNWTHRWLCHIGKGTDV